MADVTPSPIDPLTLVCKYLSAIADPVDYENSLLSKEAGKQVHCLYDSYLDQRMKLDAQFWKDVHTCPEEQKSALSNKMRSEPAFEQLRGFDNIKVMEAM